jgi:hypothetical protein
MTVLQDRKKELAICVAKLREDNIIIFGYGCVLIFLGCLGLVHIVMNPFHLLGATIYLCLGIWLTLLYGKDYLNWFLPSPVISLLYEK